MVNPLEKLRHPRSPHELLVARLTLLTLATIAIDLVASLIFYLLERHAPGTDVHSYEEALFWTSSQLTSVSSSIANPLTTGGHILAIVIDVLAVGVVTLLIGTIVQHIHLVSPRREAYFKKPAGPARSKRSSGGGSRSKR